MIAIRPTPDERYSRIAARAVDRATSGYWTPRKSRQIRHLNRAYRALLALTSPVRLFTESPR